MFYIYSICEQVITNLRQTPTNGHGTNNYWLVRTLFDNVTCEALGDGRLGVVASRLTNSQKKEKASR